MAAALRVLDLFSGVGGFALGFERAGMRTAAFCEIDPFCREWLAQHWPGVPIYSDVRALDGRAVGPIDVVCGGFPCQDISPAGNGAGLDGARSGLWFDMLRIVREVRPTWVVIENVPRLRTLGADRVLDDLESAGYSPWPFVVGADDVEAPHRRKRVWIIAGLMAHHDSGRRQGERFEDDRGLGGAPRDITDRCCRAWPIYSGQGEPLAARISAYVGDPDCAGLEGFPRDRALGRWWRRNDSCAPSVRARFPAGPGEVQHGWEAERIVTDAQCRLGAAADGIPAYLGPPLNRARLKAAGNGVLPDIPEAIGRMLVRLTT